jgi:hypothetical protein
MPNLKPLREIAKVIRSKNAGPFEITFDIIFSDGASYLKVKNANVVTQRLISTLYGVPEADFITVSLVDRINAIKITLPRPRPQGSTGETDMHACQQHVPIAEIMIPWDAAPSQEL